MQPPSPADPFRRDCARIVRARAFRALAGKTQVVPLPRGDRVRTRLSHVMEVAAIGRDIAAALGLRESLTEAIGLAHDLGHPPFGHVGERVLAHLAGNFHHAAHGIRVVEVLEPMDLTPETRAGILLHSKGKGGILLPAVRAMHATPEAGVLRVADLIAYASHDTEDAAELGYVLEADLPAGVREFLRASGAEGTLPERIARAFSDDVVRATRAAGGERAAMSAAGESALDSLRDLLYRRFYERAELLAYVPGIESVLGCVFDAAARGRSTRDALDVVAAMTDRAAVAAYDAAMRTRRRKAS